MVQAVSTVEEFKTIINGDRPVVIDFWATWCGPCKLIGPIFEKLSGQFPGADYYKVDIDAAPEIAQEVGVRASGEKLGKVVSANPGALQKLIQTVSA